MIGGLLPSPGPTPRKPSRLAFLLVAAIGPLILLALAFWVDGQFREIQNVRSLVRMSSERRIAAADLLRAVTQAESAQRGYVITGDPAYLARYRSALGSSATDLSRLRANGADLAAEAATVARLQRLVAARSREMTIVIGLRRREGLGAASARIAAGRGVLVMDKANAAAADLNRALTAKLGSRLRYLNTGLADLKRLQWALMLLICLLILLASGAFWQSRMRRYRSDRNTHEAATLLREMFTGNADATFLLDPNGVIQAANAAAVRLFGYSYDEMLGRNGLKLFDAVGKNDFKTRIGLVGSQLARPYWLDRVLRHRDGHGIAVDIALGGLELTDAIYIIATVRDIGERKTVERMKDEFLATVSHELRTPLTSVIGALGLLRGGSGSALPDSAQRLIEIAENNSRRLIRLINDLLDIDKIGSGRMRFERAPFDLAGSARAAIEDAHGLAEERAVRVELAAGPRPLVVDGDHDRLLQVLANLLSNAIRASPVEGLVLVSVARESGQIVVTVDDEGPGVTPEFADRVFERFAQASGAVPGGSGLGLAIAREIVVAHQGRIWFGEAPGGGARFAFSLPAAIEQQPLRGSRPCILVGESDGATALRLRAMLEAQECAVECVTTDREVEAAALTGRYDALLVDVALSGVGGLKTARALHRRAQTRKLPVIIMSPADYPRPSDGNGTSLELIDWIVRPIDPIALVAAVQRAMKRSAANRPTLLHIDGDPEMLEVAAAVLAEHGRIVHATSIASARAVLATQSPDIVIFDLSLPDGTGSALLRDLVRADGTSIPAVIYSAIDVPPEIEQEVDAVLIKSRRSLGSLARAIQWILASVDDDTKPA